MVYSGAIDRIIGRPAPKTGDVVLLADGTEKPIGWGLYNSVSMFCVRLMQQEEEMLRDSSCSLNMEKLLEARIAQAAELRRLLGLPSSGTNTYHLVNSEGDRLSGLIVDVFGDVAVVASPALELAKENVLLNNLDPCKISFVKQDATEFMKDAASRNESWDVVILDPPKLAPRKKILAGLKLLQKSCCSVEVNGIFDLEALMILLEEVLEGLTNIDLVLNLRLREEALIAKCLGRRICSECGGNYNIASIDIKSEKGGR